MRLRALVLVSLLVSPLAAHAQSEAALSEAAFKEYCEGGTVKLKPAMPGTQGGVDLYPGTAKPLDFPRHAYRLTDYGTALRAGDQALVTKLKAKLIEFQLDGGGYGTSGIRQRRLEGGSRFNIRYRDGIPATAITPEARACSRQTSTSCWARRRRPPSAWKAASR
jgi:hypothetical protein